MWKWSWTTQTYCPGNFLEKMRKTTKEAVKRSGFKDKIQNGRLGITKEKTGNLIARTKRKNTSFFERVKGSTVTSDFTNVMMLC
jgi:hypothetical protein